jgi:protein phosphatase
VLKLFHRFFKKTKQFPADGKTAPLPEEHLATVTQLSQSLKPNQLIVGVGQSSGRQRNHNEDTLFMLNAILTGTTDEKPIGIFIVADGMGGHQNGEVASSTATRFLANHLIRKIYLPFFSLKLESPQQSLQEIIKEGILAAQQAVIQMAPGGGTTLTAVIVLGGQVITGHVGDSRAYFLSPDGTLENLTRDHSLVQRLVELGQLTEEEALTHPQRNVLYRALGQGEPFDPDISSHPLPKPGWIILCTDGLWGVLKEEIVVNIIRTAPTVHAAAQLLVDAANAAGGPDNISVILAYSSF